MPSACLRPLSSLGFLSGALLARVVGNAGGLARSVLLTLGWLTLLPPAPAHAQRAFDDAPASPCPHVAPQGAGASELVLERAEVSFCMATWVDDEGAWVSLSRGERDAPGVLLDRMPLERVPGAARYAAVDADGDGQLDVVRGVPDRCGPVWRDTAVWSEGAFRPALFRASAEASALVGRSADTGRPLLVLAPHYATRSSAFGPDASGVGDVFALGGEGSGWASSSPGAGDWLRLPLPAFVEASAIELATPEGAPPLRMVVHAGGASYSVTVTRSPQRFVFPEAASGCIALHIAAVGRPEAGVAQPPRLALARAVPVGEPDSAWLRGRFDAACDAGGPSHAERLGRELAPRVIDPGAHLDAFAGADACAQRGLGAWLSRMSPTDLSRRSWVASPALNDATSETVVASSELTREAWLEAAELSDAHDHASLAFTRLLDAALTRACEGCAARAAFLWPPRAAAPARSDALLSGVALAELEPLDELPRHRGADDAELARRTMAILATAEPSRDAPEWVDSLVEEAMRSPDGSVARLAFGVVARHELEGNARELERARLTDPDAPIRLEAWRATYALARTSERDDVNDACAVLDASMGDASPLVRMWAASASSNCGTSLASWLSSESWPQVRRALLLAMLGDPGSRETERAVAEWLRDAPASDVDAIALELHRRPPSEPADWLPVAFRADISAPALRRVVRANASGWEATERLRAHVTQLENDIARVAWLEGSARTALGAALAYDALDAEPSRVRYAGFRSLLADASARAALIQAAERERDPDVQAAMRADLEAHGRASGASPAEPREP